MKKSLYAVFILLIPAMSVAQTDTTKSNPTLSGDFRFRIEQDWNSLKSDGTVRDDRTRLRYRGRFGITYEHKNWISFGLRLRTGDPQKQQDPQLTFGDGFGEFSTLPVSFEHIYAQFNHKWFAAWIGKNTFPFEKQNELFWSDNVFPEGISVSGVFHFDSKMLQTLQVNSGHFVVATRGTSFDADSYFQGFQLVTTHGQNRLKLFPAFYFFNQMPNIPDGNGSYNLDFAIFHMGAKVHLLQKQKLVAEVDYYYNLKDLDRNDSIPPQFRDQKQGVIISASLGTLQKAGNWNLRCTYTYLQKFAAIDFLAQNDWARWDYASSGSPDGRLTNFKGLEIMSGYAFDENLNLQVRYFKVKQLVPLGSTKETGDRIRLDLNIRF